MAFLVDKFRQWRVRQKVDQAVLLPPSPQNRTRHPREASTQVARGRCSGLCPRRLDGARRECWHYQNRLCHWGELRLRHAEEKEEPLTGEDGRILLLEDLYKHCLILGGPGSGKTFTALSQIVREIFRSTHMEDGPVREALKPGLLMIEAKAEFPRKIWNLAVQYGRSDDVHIFGPDHVTRINPFADRTLTPAMLADTMSTLMSALEPGKSQDDFWNRAAKLLFTNIFLMYQAIQGQTGVEPMSFDLLYRMLADRGQSRNADEVRQTAQQADDAYQEFVRTLRGSLDFFRELRRLVPAFADAAILLGEQAEAGLKEMEPSLRPQKPTSGPDQTLLTKKREPLLLRKEALLRAAGLTEKILGALSDVTDEDDSNAEDTDDSSPVVVPPIPLSRIADALLTNVQAFLAEEPSVPLFRQVTVLNRLFVQLDQRLAGFFHQTRNLSEVLKPLIEAGEARAEIVTRQWESSLALMQQWEQHGSSIHAAQRLWFARTKRKASERYGLLKTYLNLYTERRKAAADPEKSPYRPDSVEEYFTGTYLNLANDKTSGSIGMTASNMVGMLSQHPFSQLFSPDANFSIRDIVHEGKILVLDMNFSFYRGAAELAAILIKCEFFRFVLSKPPSLRPSFYLVDEYATIATGGLYTGEKSFADKARGFGCGVVLALQNLPMLKARFPEAEVDGLIGVMQMMIYMRNGDPETNRRAAASSGPYRKAHATLTGSAMDYLWAKPGQNSYQIHFQDGTWIEPSDFETLVPGECLFLLPPEFGSRRMRRRIRLAGEPVASVDREGVLKMP